MLAHLVKLIPKLGCHGWSTFMIEASFLYLFFFFFDQVADYKIVRMIDHGCEGAVYLVLCQRPRLPDPSKMYALKVMFNIFQLGSMTQVGGSSRSVDIHTTVVFGSHGD